MFESRIARIITDDTDLKRFGTKIFVPYKGIGQTWESAPTEDKWGWLTYDFIGQVTTCPYDLRLDVRARRCHAQGDPPVAPTWSTETVNLLTSETHVPPTKLLMTNETFVPQKGRGFDKRGWLTHE